MKTSIRKIRWMSGLLVAAMVLATVAPAAEADHRRGRRYKGWSETRVVTRYHSPGSVYIVRESSAGPAIAGFLGGLFLGATLAHAAPAGYVYHDPYCDRSFVTLEVYRSHLHHYHHPRVVRVIERDSGACVHTYHYDNGGWHAYHGDWDDD